jgi:hypothetical protein
MDEVYLRALLEHATSEEPSMGQLVENSLHAGKRLARRRRIEGAIAAAVGIALAGIAIPAALGALSTGHHQHPGPATSRHGSVSPTAYVWTGTGERGTTFQASNAVIGVRLATGKVLQPVKVEGQIAEIAAAPDGRTLYAFSYKAVHAGYAYYVTPISTRTDRAGKAIRLSIGVQQNAEVKVAPNGRTAYVAGQWTVGKQHFEVGGIVAINLRTGAERKMLETGSGPFVITPDGRYAYATTVAVGLQGVNLATGATLPAVSVPGGDAEYVALTPDGKTAYATSQTYGSGGTTHIVTWVTPIDLAANRAGKSIKVQTATAGNISSQIAITPDGRTAYVYGGPDVIPISLASGKVLRPIVAGGHNTQVDLAIDPNGLTAYANTEDNRLLPIDTVTSTVLRRIHVPAGSSQSIAYQAFDPSGNVLYLPGVTTRRGQPQDDVLIPISTATQHFGKLINLGPGSPQQIVIVP